MKKIFKSQTGDTAFYKNGPNYINEKGNTSFHKEGPNVIDSLGNPVAYINSDRTVTDSAGNTIGTAYNSVFYDNCGNPIFEE